MNLAQQYTTITYFSNILHTLNQWIIGQLLWENGIMGNFFYYTLSLYTNYGNFYLRILWNISEYFEVKLEIEVLMIEEDDIILIDLKGTLTSERIIQIYQLLFLSQRPLQEEFSKAWKKIVQEYNENKFIKEKFFFYLKDGVSISTPIQNGKFYKLIDKEYYKFEIQRLWSKQIRNKKQILKQQFYSF